MRAIRRNEKGQALTEAVVVCAVLVPLFLLIPIIGKYTHIKQQAQQATRNAAWEMTATQDHGLANQAKMKALMIDRAFARADSPIRSNSSGSATGNFDDTLLNTFSGKKLVLKQDASVTGRSEKSSPGFISGVISKFPKELPGDFPPNAKGYITVKTRIDIRNLQGRDGSPARYLAPFDNLGLQLNREQSLLVDAWNAAGSGAPGTRSSHKRSVIQQVESLVPTSNLKELSKGLDAIGSIPLPITRRLKDLDIGYIEPDIVPIKKLERYPVRGN
ncbi:TadE/TadG family type IV pilus assembly protein [Solilutibacter tolerans]|uniref:TadE-like protein n=1 Tax=Solilutibacter tolerans TaxID=1604334 RepID=A0A1N6RJN7_9GAMM|nr:TadE family protein [Lysobacter tolerans]SIQ28932.1 hypothetical protein SAMN05421546_1021 [Lysobacter tolerans]